MAKNATLRLYGDIGENNAPEQFMGDGAHSVSANDIISFLEANTEADQITVRINSRGGDVQEGWLIYDLLTNSGKKIITIGEGRIYSIATIVFLAGSERHMMKNADGLIHNPYIPPYTLADAYESGDLLKIAEGLQQEEEKILSFYAEKTGTDKAKLAEYMKDETKLSAEDMVTLGFATKVIEPVKAYAYLKPKSFNMTPQEEKAFFERLGEKIDNAVAKVAGFSRLPVTNQEMTDKDGNKFTLDKEEGAPAVGDSASPDGTYTMSDGKVITIAEGKVTEVAEAKPEEDEEMKAKDQEIADLKAKVADLETQVTAVNESKAAFEAEKTAFAAQVTEVNALVEDLRSIKNTWKPEGRTKDTGKTDGIVAGTVDIEKVKEIREKMNK